MAKQMITREQRKRKSKVNIEDWPCEIIYSGIDGTAIYAKKMARLYWKWREEELEKALQN